MAHDNTHKVGLASTCNLCKELGSALKGGLCGVLELLHKTELAHYWDIEQASKTNGSPTYHGSKKKSRGYIEGGGLHIGSHVHETMDID